MAHVRLNIAWDELDAMLQKEIIMNIQYETGKSFEYISNEIRNRKSLFRVQKEQSKQFEIYVEVKMEL